MNAGFTHADVYKMTATEIIEVGKAEQRRNDQRWVMHARMTTFLLGAIVKDVKIRDLLPLDVVMRLEDEADEDG